MGDEMTTKRELRADKITVLAGLAANPAFVTLGDDARYALYCDAMELVKDVHEDHQDEETTTETPAARAAFSWDATIAAVVESGHAFRRDYPNKNTAQTTASKLKTKFKEQAVRIMTADSETGGGTIIITKRVR